MKYLMVTSPLTKEFGGPPVAVVGAACSLSKLGVDIKILVFGQSQQSWDQNTLADSLKNQSINVFFFPSKITSKYGGFPGLLKLNRIWNLVSSSDVISLHQIYNYQNLLIGLFAKVLRKPYVVMPHGTFTDFQRRQHYSRKILINWIFSYAFLNKATGFFVATETERNEMPQKYKEKTLVVGLGISPAEHVVVKHADALQVFTFIYVGRITLKKRIDVSIKALERAAELSSRRIRFIICGSGDETITRQIIEFKTSNSRLSIEFKGWQEGNAKSKLLNDADAFILTSEDENFAIAVAEGLSYGLPCLISKKVALSSLVQQYNAGLVFDELDDVVIANLALHLMNSVISSYSANALAASKELAWEKVAGNWATALSNVIEDYK